MEQSIISVFMAITLQTQGKPPHPYPRMAQVEPIKRIEVKATPKGGSFSGKKCDLDYIKQKESGGNYQSYNKQGSGASGAYQVMPNTWRGYMGYQNAADAPPEVQDKFAAELYARRGSQPWSVCK